MVVVVVAAAAAESLKVVESSHELEIVPDAEGEGPVPMKIVGIGHN